MTTVFEASEVRGVRGFFDEPRPAPTAGGAEMATAVAQARSTMSSSQQDSPVDKRWSRDQPAQRSKTYRNAGEAFEGRDDAGETIGKIKSTQCNWRPVRYDIYDYYDIGHVLGEGCSGVVKFATSKATGKEWAVKMIDLNTAEQSSDFAVEAIRREIEIMKLVDHPSCVQLYEVIEQTWRNTHIMFLTLELLGGGDLFERINIAPITERDVARLARDVLMGLDYIHSQGIVHRDIKPENLLFASSDPTSEHYNTIKISDFGLAAVLNPPEQLRDMCGTPGYVAPEVVNPKLTGDIEVNGVLVKAGYSTPVDIWSTGVLIYECLCGSTPFHDEDVGLMLQNTMRGEYSFDAQMWQFVSGGAKNLISKMLVLNPYSRKSAVQLLEDQWIVECESMPETELAESGDVLMMKRDSRSASTWNIPRRAEDSPPAKVFGAQSDKNIPLWEDVEYEPQNSDAMPVFDDRVGDPLNTPKGRWRNRGSVQEGRAGDSWRG